MKKQTRTAKIEVRVTPDEKSFLQKAAEKKGMNISNFVRFVAVEMAEAIATNKSPEDTYHALIMSSAQIAPEILLYSASAEYTPLPKRSEENDEGET